MVRMWVIFWKFVRKKSNAFRGEINKSAALVFETLELDECKYNHTKKGYRIICYLWIYEYVTLCISQCGPTMQPQTVYSRPLMHRDRPRFFVQVGHQTTYASIGNRHFFTISCHHQAYQNYEQSRQKLGTFLENKIF